MKEYFKSNPTVIITIILILSSCLGMYYDYVLYSNFNINIFQISEIEDFLFSWIKNERIIIGFIFLGSLIIANYIAHKTKNIFNGKYTVISLILLICTLIINILSEQKGIFILVLGFFIFLIMRIFEKRSREEVLKIEFMKNIVKISDIMFILIFAIIIPFTIIYSGANKEASKNKKLTYQYYNIKIKKEKDILKNYSFVGKNSNYHIFYKGTKNKNETILINNSDIKYIKDINN